VVFDKRYYEEFFRRAWIPRNQGTAVQDWTWGGNNNGSPRFFLNVDMCLLFDIEATFPCCTDTSQGTACDRNGQVLRNTPCASYPAGSPRLEAANAVDLFSDRRPGGGFGNDNTPFYNAFASAWGKATTNGLSDLQPLVPSPTSSPTILSSTPPTLPQPSASPTLPQPSASPTLPQPSSSPTPNKMQPGVGTDGSLSPTGSPTSGPSHPPTPGPTRSPTIGPSHPPTPDPTNSSPPPTPNPTGPPTISSGCEDVASFRHNGKTRTCQWVIDQDRCRGFAHLCPVSCNACVV